MHKQSRSTQIKRIISIFIGMTTLGVSLLAGALTSAAAAEDALRPAYVLEGAPMVELGIPVSEHIATNDMRVNEGVRFEKGRTDKFANPNRAMQSGCTIDFNDSDALLVQTEYARNQFAVDPWRERCGDVWSEVIGTKHDHLHLDYTANDIGPCLDGLDPLGGMFARLSTGPGGEQICTDFDPLTEPRTSPRSHTSSEVVRFRMYDIDGYQPFRLNQVRVIDQAIRLCAQPVDAELGVVFGGAGNGGMSGATCWTLAPGLWDLSSYTDNTAIVTMTGAVNNGSPFSFDDFNITDQS